MRGFAHLWKEHREEMLAIHKATHLGSKRTVKTCDNISKALIGKCAGKKHWHWGGTTSETTKKKQSLARMGKPGPTFSFKQRKALGEKQKATWTPERRKKNGENHSGSKSNFWRGGKGKQLQTYGEDWTAELRESIFKRDNYSCQCLHRHHHRRRLDVHHIDWNKRNNDPKNLITLCNGCHMAIHRKYKPGVIEPHKIIRKDSNYEKQ